MTLYAVVLDNRLMEATFVGPNNVRYAASYALIFQWMISKYILTFAQAFFLGAVGIMMFSFWCYHLYLAATNTTTNESFKWGDVKDIYRSLKTVMEKSNPRLEKLIDEQWSDQEKRRLATTYAMIQKKRPLQYMYNEGVISNLKQVIFPRSLFPSSKFLETSIAFQSMESKTKKKDTVVGSTSTPHSPSSSMVNRRQKKKKR